MDRCTFLAPWLASALLAAPGAAQSGAEINIAPRRVVMAEGQRSATVHLFNQGDQPAAYRITLADMAMTPAGDIVPVAASPSSSAVPLLDYTPRNILLGPGQSQAVRIRLRQPASPGEYRAHFTVTAQPPEDVGLTAEQATMEAGPAGIAMRVVALMSISIPVIVRSGPVSASTEIENVRLHPAAGAGSRPAVSLDLVRSGTGSTYGNVEIVAGQGRTERPVGRMRGIAVYPEIHRRAVTVNLDEPVAPGERLRLAYRAENAEPGADLATVSLVLP